jgi:hypothetical protein
MSSRYDIALNKSEIVSIPPKQETIQLPSNLFPNYKEYLFNAVQENPSQCWILDLRPEEKILAELVYWLRNRNIKKEGAISWQVYPGPSGHKTQKGVWYPNPIEACDAFNGPIIIVGEEGSARIDPWGLYKHCKSMQHVKYMVRYRSYLLINRIFHGDLSRIYRAYQIILNLPSANPRDDAMLVALQEDVYARKFTRID